MKNLRKVLVALMCISIVMSKQSIAFATDGNQVLNDVTSANTKIEGEIAATIINVSIPTVMAFSIDPNDEENSYTCSVSSIKNLSTAPIEVSIGVGDENFRQDISSDWKPTNLLPEDKEWDTLGVKESESSLALGIKINDPSEWRAAKLTETLWVVNQNASSEKIIFGDIDSGASADVTLELRHGNAFNEEKSCSYNIIWSFALSND